MGNLFQNILFIVLLVAVAGGVFYWYTSSPADQAALTTLSGIPEVNIEFLNLLRTLKTIQFDTAFFQDPLYQSLLDSNVKISTPSERGKVNPFMPVSF